jgi:hypothetical protein
MATTDAKSGFRLPWSADRNESDTQAEEAVVDTTGEGPAQAASELEASTMTDTAPTPYETGTEPSSTAVDTPSANAVTRKPNKFMADLTRAMQAAAEAARAESLERFGAEAKAHIETIHASTADEATGLRKKADDDLAAIREWSKTEIARIREETDERIAHRKEVLDREIEAHAAQIESRIERVQQRVAGFESQMASFFERLLAEDDPTRFAAMAESLPEAPPFDADAAWEPAVAAPTTDVWATPAVESSSVAVDEAPAEAAAEAIETPTADEPVAEATTVDEPETVEAPASSDDELIGGESSNGAAPWGPLASPVTAESTDTPASQDTDDSGDLFGMAADAATTDETDPRLSALGLDADFAAAEAEAGAFPIETRGSDEEIPVIADDALAARLAGLVPEVAGSGETSTTRVVVTGLVSVASIAGFKRTLARLSGVHSVGVTSGPDGEFVFSVNHDPSMALGEQIATLPGFGARVTNEGPGELTVAARDPEAEG